ncbi:MAG: ferredoxin [Candidatus Roizmanbacteria bacterium]|nr:ferredoxin [Candidatus Roizmanbacteria bacterium]MCR4312619.1 ferredoxin [Candidatus Roizmanbacteria bacterium]
MDPKLRDEKSPSGPITLKSGYKIWVDRNLCIGAATCIAVSPKAYVLDKEAKAVILDTIDEDTIENIIESAKACPVAAIIIEDAQGNRVFPK